MNAELPRGTAESIATLEWSISKSYRSYLVMVLVFSVFVLASCMTKPEAPPVELQPVEPPPPVMIEHRVKYSGETLGLIARWYTGKSANWPMLVEANPGLVPERINIGDVILIPEDILVERRPLPARAVRAVPKKVKTEESRAGSAEAEDWLDVGSDGSSVAIEQGVEFVPESELNEISGPESLGEGNVQPPESMGVSKSADTKPKAEGGEQPENEVSEEDAERERLLDELLAE
jgi:hypothetical protein